MGDRRIHPRPATQPGCNARRRAPWCGDEQYSAEYERASRTQRGSAQAQRATHSWTDRAPNEMSNTTIDNKSCAAPAVLTEIRTIALFAGLVGAAGLVVAGFLNFQEFLRGYLIAYVYVLGLSLGGLALLMTGHLTGGNWWMLGRRIFEAAGRCIPLLAILFLPILLGAKQL